MPFGCCLQAFGKGVGPFLEAVREHDFLHATKLTLMLAAISVPLNTLFGTVAAILITRNEFPGKVCALVGLQQRTWVGSEQVTCYQPVVAR